LGSQLHLGSGAEGASSWTDDGARGASLQANSGAGEAASTPAVAPTSNSAHVRIRWRAAPRHVDPVEDGPDER
jgi:hypothetical protein